MIDERPDGHRRRGAVVWFTGLPASGKSTLAAALARPIADLGWPVTVLDGDALRTGLNADLGFTAADRAENVRRVAEVAKLFAEAGVVAVTALISPAASERARARQIVARGSSGVPFIEVYLETPLAICEARDPKGMYARARAGEIKDFTGVSAPYEAPAAPDLTIDTSQIAIEDAVARVAARLRSSLAGR